MDSSQLTPHGKAGIPRILWWSAIPSSVIAAIWSANYMSILAQGQSNDSLLTVVLMFDFPIEFLVFLVLVWTPLLGVILIVCTFFRLTRPFCSWKAWLFLAALLLPFYVCFHTVLTTPTMATYRQFFHLHQQTPANTRLSEDQAIAIFRQIVVEHTNRLENYKQPSVVFYPYSGEWILISFPKIPDTVGKPETQHTIYVRIVDKTGNAGYRELVK